MKSYPLSINACKRCSHHQLGIVVDPKLMFSNYAYASGTSESFRQHFSSYAKEIHHRYPQAEKFIECGSNDGVLLKALLDVGAKEAIGVEPAENLVDKCHAELLNVIHGFMGRSDTMPKLLARGRTFDFWTANNGLAHVDDFVGTLNALALTGAKAGVFEVQYLGALLDHGHVDNIYHEHLDFWRATELLDKLHVRTPWAVVDIELVPTHGGSLRVWVQLVEVGVPIGPIGGQVSKSLADIVNAEKNRDWPAAWLTLRTKMAEERKQLWALLGDNKRVAIFGAPAKLTTLLYGLGITNLHFSYVVDDSPLKQGLFTPGMGLEVISSERLRADPPDAVLIGAWNFANHIVPRVADLCPGKPIVVPFEK